MDLSSLGLLEEKMREIERVRKEKEEQRKKEKEWERQEKIKNQETFTYRTNEAFERYSDITSHQEPFFSMSVRTKE